MENSGWIYLRVDGERGYCFGKTDSPDRRDSEYRKENPFIKKIYDFFVADMIAVESELIKRTAHLRLFSNSKEWIHFCDEARQIVDEVRKQHALMTHGEWQQLIKEEAYEEIVAQQQSQKVQLPQGKVADTQPHNSWEAVQWPTTDWLQAEMRRWEYEKADNDRREALKRLPPEEHARRHDEYKNTVTVFRKKQCHRCHVVAIYDAAITGYRCPTCKMRCV